MLGRDKQAVQKTRYGIVADDLTGAMDTGPAIRQTQPGDLASSRRG